MYNRIENSLIATYLETDSYMARISTGMTNSKALHVSGILVGFPLPVVPEVDGMTCWLSGESTSPLLRFSHPSNESSRVYTYLQTSRYLLRSKCRNSSNRLRILEIWLKVCVALLACASLGFA